MSDLEGITTINVSSADSAKYIRYYTEKRDNMVSLVNTTLFVVAKEK